MAGTLRSLRAVCVLLLILVAAMVAGIGFGHSADAAHLAVDVSWSQQAVVHDVDHENSGAEYCAVLCATADAATPVQAIAATTGACFVTVRSMPAPIALPLPGSPGAPSPLRPLSVLRI